MKRIVILITILAFLFGCVGKYQPEDEPQIVVEGWIEAGGYPVVILTTTVSVGEQQKDWASLKDHVIRWAKVSISDGEEEVVLTGRKNDDYFPPYIYSTARIQGEAGKTYTLKVEYSGRTVTAQTSVPDAVPLEWIKVVPSQRDGYADIVAGLKDNPSTKDYYKFFTWSLHDDSTYVPSFMGLINDEILADEVNEVMVQRGAPQVFGDADTSLSFSDHSFVLVKFCTMDEASYMYWEDYEDIAFLSRNPFFPVTCKIRSNVQGGLGYWVGYGSTVYRLSLADSLKVR